MNELKIFNNEEFGQIRSLEIYNEVWFVGKDIATALGYSNANRDVVNHIDEDDRIMLNEKTQYQNGIEFNIKDLGQRGGWIINESGVYSLILSSKLPNAKKFKRWITSEVLPTIRKKGAYITDDLLSNPEALLKVVQNYKQEYDLRMQAEKRVSELEEVNESQMMVISELNEKKSYLENVLQNSKLHCATQIAKDYGMTPQQFNKLLNELHIQYKANGQWVLYKEYAKEGYMQSYRQNISNRVGYQAYTSVGRWTGKGVEFIYNKLKSLGILPLIETETV